MQGVRRTTLEKFFRQHHSHRKEISEKRLAAIKEAVPRTTDPAGSTSSVVLVKARASQLQTTRAAVKEFDRQSEVRCRSHEDFEVFTALPGAGKVYAARLLVALGANRERWTNGSELLCFSGGAPVIALSGKSSWTRWRYFCPKFFRQSFIEYAGESIRHSEWAQTFYVAQKAKGKSHQAAVRALAYKRIRISWKCWQTRTKYDEARYVEGLRKKGSALVAAATGDEEIA